MVILFGLLILTCRCAHRLRRKQRHSPNSEIECHSHTDIKNAFSVILNYCCSNTIQKL